jgi:hypothetical protein
MLLAISTITLLHARKKDLPEECRPALHARQSWYQNCSIRSDVGDYHGLVRRTLVLDRRKQQECSDALHSSSTCASAPTRLVFAQAYHCDRFGIVPVFQTHGGLEFINSQYSTFYRKVVFDSSLPELSIFLNELAKTLSVFANVDIPLELVLSVLRSPLCACTTYFRL